MSSATATTQRSAPAAAARTRRRRTPARVVLYVFVTLTALAWLFPVFWAVFNSFRDYDYTSTHGYVSLGGFTFENYTNAWEQGQFTRHFLNSLIITVPAVLLTLFLASCVAFVVARYSFRFNLVLLGLFTAANLLPQQALLIPLYRAYREIPLPLWMSDSGQLLDSYWGLILVNVAFQTGFCTFVLSNYMKALPHEMFEAARVDGAGFWRRMLEVTIPLTLPVVAVAALFGAILTFTDMTVVYVLTRGGPNHATQVLASWAFIRGIEGGDVAQGAAVALFLFPLLLAAAIAILRAVRRMEVL